MAQRDVITEAIIQAALEALEGRIAIPPLHSARTYSRREAFAKLRAKAREALAAGHSLETVLDDLKGVGLGMTLSTARQYLKPGKTNNKKCSNAKPKLRTTSVPECYAPAPAHVDTAPETSVAAKKGTFTAIEDDNEI
jgi:hypothetical protein